MIERSDEAVRVDNGLPPVAAAVAAIDGTPSTYAYLAYCAHAWCEGRRGGFLFVEEDDACPYCGDESWTETGMEVIQ